MKRHLLLPLLATVLISACCTQKYCHEESRVHISFRGFTPSEVDTIYTTGYAIGSDFTQITRAEFADTVRIVYNEDSTFMLTPREDVGVVDGLIHTAEWKVYIPSVNKTLLINNYGYRSFKCNRCFPVSTRDNKIRSLSTCSVNGVTTYVNEVEVRK